MAKNPSKPGSFRGHLSSFDPVDLVQLAETLQNLVALGEGTVKEKAGTILREMKRLDADDDLDTFLSWFSGEGWDEET